MDGKIKGAADKMEFRVFPALIIGILLLAPLSAQATDSYRPAENLKVWQLPEVSYPENNPNKKVTEELGKQLFFDPRLSGSRALSCASCHHPGLGWTDPLPNTFRPVKSLERQTPSLINVAYQKRFFWDGRSDSLEKAIELHLKEQSLTAISVPALPAAYKQKFEQAFGSPAITSISISKALANFLRTIVSRNSPFDRWIAGDKNALSLSAQRGFKLFTGKAGCVNCHTPPLFSDSAFHNTGLDTLDPGHFDISGNPEDRNRFRTPALRHISQTAPYMHMGSKRSLMQVIEYYSTGGDGHGSNNEIHKIGLTEQQEQELLDFLMSLTGSNITAEVPQLPSSIIP